MLYNFALSTNIVTYNISWGAGGSVVAMLNIECIAVWLRATASYSFATDACVEDSELPVSRQSNVRVVESSVVRASRQLS